MGSNEVGVNIRYPEHVDSQDIVKWLEQTVPHAGSSPSGRTGFDRLQRPVYGVYASVKRVYIRDKKYAEWFILKWL